ncbi:hypothetical protein ACQ4PT_035254 [Festuca glaucescens]
MESTGSGSHSTAPTYPGSPSLAIRDEEKKKGTFKCKFCPRVFASLRARGGHVKVHKEQNQKQPMHRRPAPPPPVRVWSTLSKDPRLRSACRNLHAARFNAWPKRYFRAVPLAFARTGGHAPAQPSSATKRCRRAKDGGHSRSLHLREVNRETAKVKNYSPSPLSGAIPFSLSQTGSGTSGLTQTSFAVPTLAPDGNSRTGDGDHLGGQEVVPEVNLEQADDGIDLTLRL